MQGGKRLVANGVNAETKYPNMNLLTPPILPLFPSPGQWYRGSLHLQWAHTDHSTNLLSTSPLCFSRDTTITDIGIDVEIAATTGGVARLGIYADSQSYDVNGIVYPGKLIVDSGEIITSTTGDKIITLTNPVILPACTIIWLTSIFGVAGPQCWYGTSSQNIPGSSTPNAQGTGSYSAYIDYGPLPAIFPSELHATDWNITAVKLG